jgi:putative flippase GtrA
MSVSLESLMRDQAAMPAPSALVQLLAFAAIGGGAALSFVVVSALAVSALPAVPSWLVSALCYAAYIVPVYLLHRRFAFRSDARHSHALPRYVVVQLVGLGLATVFSWLAYGVIGLPTATAAILVIALTSGINFLVLRGWAFARI